MSELIIAVVPIRSFSEGKTRLAPVLTPQDRAEFLRQSAERVISAALDSRVVDTVVVVSPDPEALAWSAGFGARVRALPQPSDRPGLNGAMDGAREWALERDADSMLSLFADLPLLSIFDVRRLTSRRNPVVLGPDRRCNGTNAMLLRLQGDGAQFRFSFGEGSLAKHLDEARRLGMKPSVQEIPGIGFDLDTPRDWADYLQVLNGGTPPVAGEESLMQCGAQSG